MGAVGREALDQPMAHGVGGLEADAAALDLVGGAGRVVGTPPPAKEPPRHQSAAGPGAPPPGPLPD